MQTTCTELSQVWAQCVQDNYPHLEYTALDLSPYYLYEARRNIKGWHRLRQPQLKMGGVDGSGTHFLQAAAESIPQPDESHDVVSITTDIRQAIVMQAMYRLCCIWSALSS